MVFSFGAGCGSLFPTGAAFPAGSVVMFLIDATSEEVVGSMSGPTVTGLASSGAPFIVGPMETFEGTVISHHDVVLSDG
jgi:hypothetical protein